MIDARNVFRKVNRTINDFSPEQMANLSAIVWLYRGQGERFFALVQKYLADKRTCVLPVRLEPGQTYAIWVNTDKFGNFKDTDGRSAVPYLLVFRTKK